MKTKLTTALACAAIAAAFVAPAPAADGDHKPTYHDRFIACAHDSKGLKGDEHQKFMSDCLKGHGDADGQAKAAPHKTSAEGSQQNRMRTCNEEAGKKDLHGDERRAFMSACLKG